MNKLSNSVWTGAKRVSAVANTDRGVPIAAFIWMRHLKVWDFSSLNQFRVIDTRDNTM